MYASRNSLKNMPTLTYKNLNTSSLKFTFFFKSSTKDIFTDFRERERSGEREIERNIDPACVPTGDQTHNAGMSPGQRLNVQPFAARDNAPTN